MNPWPFRLAVLALLAAGLGAFALSRAGHQERVVSAAAKRILLIGNGTDIETLDPHMATGVPEHHIISAVFEGLVAPGADDPDANAPGVAESWESPDFTTWTFRLRPDAKWSDGAPITARDFVYAYRRILSPDLAADYAEMLHILQGAEGFNKGTTRDFATVGVQAPDDRTLRLTLTGPAPYFPSMLKHYAWYPVPRHVIERFGTMTQRDTAWARAGNLVSNGPFFLQEWRINHYIAVARNPHYWDASRVKLNGIHFFAIDDPNAEERAFLDGQLHATETVPLDKIHRYRQERPPFFHQDPELSTEFYRCNVTKPPLNDARVRRALSLAIDRETLVSRVLRGGQEAATCMTPPGADKNYPVLKTVRFAPDDARRLLKEAGYADGSKFPKIDILTNSSGPARTVAEFIQESWRKHLGIEVGVRQQDWQVYLDSMRKLDYHIARAGWTGDYPDPFTFTSIWRSFDGNNNTGWKNGRYDDLMAASARELDPKRRLEILREGEELMLDEMPAIPVYWRKESNLRRAEILNWRPSVIGHRAYKALDLAPTAP